MARRRRRVTRRPGPRVEPEINFRQRRNRMHGRSDGSPRCFARAARSLRPTAMSCHIPVVSSALLANHMAGSPCRAPGSFFIDAGISDHQTVERIHGPVSQSVSQGLICEIPIVGESRWGMHEGKSYVGGDTEGTRS